MKYNISLRINVIIVAEIGNFLIIIMLPKSIVYTYTKLWNANYFKVLPKDILSYSMITKKPHILEYHCNDIKSESVGTLKCSFKS